MAGFTIEGGTLAMPVGLHFGFKYEGVCAPVGS